MWKKGICTRKDIFNQSKGEWMRDHDARLSLIGLAASAGTCALGGHIGYRGKRRGWLYVVLGAALGVLHASRLRRLRRDYRLRAQRERSCPLCRLLSWRKSW